MNNTLRYSIAVLISCASLWPSPAFTQPAVPAKPKALPAPELIQQRLTERFEQLRRDGFSGVVQIDIGGTTVFAGAAGFADPVARRPFTLDTLVPIGSLTKPLTAAAILKLQDQRRLSVNDPISKFFVEAPAAIGSATLHQLMTHTAGIPATAPSSSPNPDLEAIDRATFLERLWAAPLPYEPGQGYLYSNAGYSLLAAVVEKVSGRSYEDFLRSEILTPAGVKRIGYSRIYDPASSARTANGLTIADSIWGKGGPHWNLLGNGGLIVVADDFVKWRTAFADGRVVSPEAVKATGTAWAAVEGGGFEGYGWMVGNSPTRGNAELAGGGNSDFTSEMRYYPAYRMVTLATTNGARPAGAATTALLSALFGEPEQQEPPANPAATALVNRLAAAVRSRDVIKRRAFLEANAGPRFIETVGLEEIERRFTSLHTSLAGARLTEVKQVGPQRLEALFVSSSKRSTLKLTLGGTPTLPKLAGFEMD